MSTAAQIAANRRNARKSTGPVTEAGRRRSRLNALQHGITRQVTIMSAEELSAFRAFCAEFVEGFAPANVHERHLAQAIAEDYWRLDRGRAVEHNLFTGVLVGGSAGRSEDPRVETAVTHARIAIDHAHHLNLLSLYEQRLNRSLHKNLALLRQLQAERKAEEAEALEQALRLRQRRIEAPRVRAAAHSSARQIDETESLAVNGFVFSNAELEHELRRRDRYWGSDFDPTAPSQSLKNAA